MHTIHAYVIAVLTVLHVLHVQFRVSMGELPLVDLADRVVLTSLPYRKYAIHVRITCNHTKRMIVARAR